MLIDTVDGGEGTPCARRLLRRRIAPLLLKRHLRRRYHPASERQRPVLRPAVGTALLLLAVFFLGEWTLRFFGVGNPLRAAAVTLTTEGRGIVNVSLEGEAAQRAENDIKLYPGDRVMTLGGGYAALRLFDGSDLRLNEATDIAIVESVHGEERSEIVLELIEGSLWIATPARSSFSGAILRRIRSPRLSFDIPSHTEALIAPNSLSVFSSDGIGIEVSIGGVPEHIVIGEGQTFLLPPGIDLKEDLYEHRSPLDPRQLASPFLEESRRIHAGAPPHPSRGSPAAEPGELLSVATPADGAAVQTTAIDVNGRMGAGVARIRVNGYQALLDRENGTFFLELNLPDEDEVSIAIEAVDEQGNVIGEIRRTVRRDREAPSPPSITAPAGSGSTYRTAAARVELRGRAPAEAVGIIVNDYRLRLFTQGSAEWSYLADLAFDNFFPGENRFEVRAINAGGTESPPAVITILQEEGPEGIVSAAASAGNGVGPEGGAFSPIPEEPIVQLPTNAPLLPGTLRVTKPATGTAYAAQEKEFVIEGLAPNGTQNVWVNDYRLRLFEPEKGFWNYIASAELGTLKRGTNEYRIVARDGDGRILDALTYTVEFRPGRKM